ncbi:MAG: glycosyltransferase family 39 protein [Bacteroidetes bacterium]|nr:glycosyltransferase family 39 protein [Bacteroidota bacterium]
MQGKFRLPTDAAGISGLLAMLLGMALLLKVYTDNRNLFLDEQNLASNVAERSYAALARPLDYEQAAPPLFLMATKLLTQAWGMYDWVLRLLPLVAGLLSLVLFRATLGRHFRGFETAGGLVLLGTAPLFVLYATEFKQYMTDVLFAVSCLYAAEKLQPNLHWKHWLLWALLGIVGIWTSMPAVFILCGVLAYYMWPVKPMRRAHMRILLLGIVWVLSFAAYWQVSLSASAKSTHFQHTHADFLLGMHWGETKFLGIMAQTFADMCMRCKGFLMPACFAGFFAVGSWALLRHRTALGGLFLVPIGQRY